MTEEADPRSALRRRDRGKDDAWIRDFLHQASWGVLATVGEGGQPFVNANLFVYDEEAHALYLHTHRTGRTRTTLGEGGPVAFTANAMGRLLPDAEALEFSVEYAGVVAFGRAVVVEDAAEAARALRLLLEKYAPHLRYGEDYRGVTEGELRRTAVYRVDVEAWSGKQKEAAPDFPGAFDLPPLPVPFAGTPGVSSPRSASPPGAAAPRRSRPG